MSRWSGFYWVKYNGCWMVGEYVAHMYSWELTGMTQSFFDENFDEIDENQLTQHPHCN